MNIRQATAADSAQVAEIYNHYIRNSTATFELDEIDAAEMAQRIERLFDRRLSVFGLRR